MRAFAGDSTITSLPLPGPAARVVDRVDFAFVVLGFVVVLDVDFVAARRGLVADDSVIVWLDLHVERALALREYDSVAQTFAAVVTRERRGTLVIASLRCQASASNGRGVPDVTPQSVA